MLATQDVCRALDARVDQVYDELRQLRGKVNGMRRWEKANADEDTPEPRQDAPGTSIGHAATMHPRALRGGRNY